MSDGSYAVHLPVTDDNNETDYIDFRVRTDRLPIPRIGESMILDCGSPAVDLTVVDVQHWIQQLPPYTAVTVVCAPDNEGSRRALLELLDSGSVVEWLDQFPAVDRGNQ